MKLNKGFLVYNKNGDTMLIPTAAAPFHGLVEENETVGLILNCLTKGR